MSKVSREDALKDAFLEAIRYVGLDGLKATSMFGSSERHQQDQRKAA